jgi:hypothetical protein
MLAQLLRRDYATSLTRMIFVLNFNLHRALGGREFRQIGIRENHFLLGR